MRIRRAIFDDALIGAIFDTRLMCNFRRTPKGGSGARSGAYAHALAPTWVRAPTPIRIRAHLYAPARMHPHTYTRTTRRMMSTPPRPHTSHPPHRREPTKQDRRDKATKSHAPTKQDRTRKKKHAPKPAPNKENKKYLHQK
jgi:hypothetical protein